MDMLTQRGYLKLYTDKNKTQCHEGLRLEVSTMGLFVPLRQ